MSQDKPDLIQQISADARWWQNFGKVLGWRLYGYTDRRTATFCTGGRSVLQITGAQRDQIMKVIEEKRNG